MSRLIVDEAIKRREPVNFIGILCPSYKKGKDQIGFKDEPGQTTYIAFNNLKRVYEKAILFGIDATMSMFFYDVAVENSNKLTEQDWEDLRQNIIQDKAIAKALNVPFGLISKTFPALKNMIVPPKKDLLKMVNEEVLKNVINESKEFYKGFGWTEEEAEKRALHMAYAYTIESSYLRKHFKNPVVIYSAYSYERMKLYEGKNRNARIGIICPPRPVGNSILATI